MIKKSAAAHFLKTESEVGGAILINNELHIYSVEGQDLTFS